MSQPLFGAVADRMRRRIFVVVGPALTVAAMGLMGLAPTYTVLLILLLLAGTGTASFHPQGASSAGQASGTQLGRGLSLFVAGGELGYSLGPLIIALVVQARGLAATWMVAVPGLVACALLWRFIPPRSPLPAAAPRGSLRADLRAAFAPLFVLWLIVVLRSVIISAYQTFLPLLLQQRGGSIIEGGWAVFLFGGIGALGGISGGTLSDRYGRRRMLALSLILGVPMLFAFVRTTGALAYVFLAAGGIAVVVTMDSRSLVSRILGSRLEDFRRVSEHIHFFARSNFRLLAERAGLRVEAVRSWGGYFHGRRLFQRAGAMCGLPAPAAERLDAALVPPRLTLYLDPHVKMMVVLRRGGDEKDRA